MLLTYLIQLEFLALQINDAFLLTTILHNPLRHSFSMILGRVFPFEYILNGRHVESCS